MPAFFFPPLAFFAIVFYPPLHVGFDLRERFNCRLCGCRLARSPDNRRSSLRGILRADPCVAQVRKSKVELFDPH